MTGMRGLLSIARSLPRVNRLVTGAPTTRTRALVALPFCVGVRQSKPTVGNFSRVHTFSAATIVVDRFRQVGSHAHVQQRMLSSEPGDTLGTSEGLMEEEAGVEGTVNALPRYLAVVEGLSFSTDKSALENLLAESGCTPSFLDVPLKAQGGFQSPQNKGVAFLEFDSDESLQKAIGLTGIELEDRWLHIIRHHTPYDECKSIIIRGMRGLETEDLANFFEEKVAKPVFLFIKADPTVNQGLAVADFETAEQAQEVLKLDGSKVGTRWLDLTLSVRGSAKAWQAGKLDKKPRKRQQSENFDDLPWDGNSIRIIIRGIPFNMPEAEIHSFFINNGIKEEDIVSLTVPKHFDMVNNRGVAMLYAKDAQVAETVLGLTGSYIGSRWLDIQYWDNNREAARKHNQNSPSLLMKKYPDLPCLLVTGLPFQMVEEEVRGWFLNNGVVDDSIEEFSLPRFRNTANNMGVCYLVINNEEMYHHCLGLTGSSMGDRWIKVVDAADVPE